MSVWNELKNNMLLANKEDFKIIWLTGDEFHSKIYRWFYWLFSFLLHIIKLCNFVSDIENSTKQSVSRCKTEIAKLDAEKNPFVTVLTVIADVCIACVMVFIFKEPCPHHKDKSMQLQIM